MDGFRGGVSLIRSLAQLLIVAVLLELAFIHEEGPDCGYLSQNPDRCSVSLPKSMFRCKSRGSEKDHG